MLRGGKYSHTNETGENCHFRRLKYYYQKFNCNCRIVGLTEGGCRRKDKI
jgi:hypothetical protein